MQEYIGAQLIVTVAVAETSTGKTKNKILLFRPADQEITPERVAETSKTVAAKAPKAAEEEGVTDTASDVEPAKTPAANPAAAGKATRKPLF